MAGGTVSRRGERAGLRLRGLRVQIVLWTVLPLTLVLIGVAFTGVFGHEQAMRALVEGRDRALAVLTASQVRDRVLERSAPLHELELDALLSQVQVGQHGVVYLVDAHGQILAHSQSDHARSSLDGHTGLAIALQDSQAGATQCRAPDGERMTLSYAPVGLAGEDWRVILEEPWHEVISPVLRYSQLMPLVAALAAVVALLTLYYGVQSIARPLQTLGRRAEQVAWGDFQATAEPVGGVEEIEDLRRSLDQMARRIQGYQRGMHDYIAAITQGQEDERRRLARELHDDTAQSLIALRQQVEMAQKLLSSDPDRAATRLVEVQAMLAATLEGVRRFSRDLRPIYLEDLGLTPALEMLARREATGATGIGTSPGAAIHFSTTGDVRRLPAALELAAYRIVQEALNNVVQHAHATNAWVVVHFEPDGLLLSVRDDGQGFEAPDQPDVLARQGHFGLMGIQERALLYGGRVTIRSTPGQGSEVTVRLPYPAQPPLPGSEP